MSSLRIAMIGLRALPARATGVDAAVGELAARLAARGHRVTVYCRRRYGDGRARERGAELRWVPAVYTKHLEAITHTGFAVADAVRRGFDIVHFHALGPSLLAALPRLAGVRTVVTVQGLDWRRGKWGPFAKLVLRLGQTTSARLPDHTIVVSRTLLAHFRARYPHAALTYVPNGAPDLAPLPPGLALERLGLTPRGYVLSLSRLVPEKGVHTLIEAFRSLRTDRRLVIVGGGSYTNSYVQALRGMAAQDARVVFTGPIYGDDAAELLSNCLMYVNPSLIEGLSLALLEALGSGTPVIVSDIPENVEAITTSTGELVGTTFHAESAPSLSRELQAALDQPDRMADLAARAQAHARRAYDWESITDATERIYREVLDRARRRSPSEG